VQEMSFTERKRRILGSIVRRYIARGEPVGSELLAQLFDNRWSSATIRNVMASLEEDGYITQPYTSAGRVPTDKGYRFYVDRLMRVRRLSNELVRGIEETLFKLHDDAHALLEHACRVLAESSKYMALATEPDFDKTTLARVEFLPHGEGHVVGVVVTGAGFVITQVLDCPYAYSEEKLRQAARELEKAFAGQEFSSIRRQSFSGDALTEALFTELRNRMLKETRRVFRQGAHFLLQKREFQDAESASGVFEVVERGEIVDILDEGAELSIRIGGEMKHRGLEECSIVRALYSAGGRTLGAIGILGPKRMQYSRVVSLVRETARILSQILERYGKL